MDEVMNKEDVLAHDPFQGDFGGPDDRTLRDKIVTARKIAECHDCGEMIVPRTMIRSRVDIADGELMSFKWCTACCEAMAVYGENPNILEDRIAARELRQEGPDLSQVDRSYP